MAKSNKPAGTSHIRFVMVDAVIADGDITSITTAITNALRGPATPVQRIAPPSNGPKVITHEPSSDEEEEVLDDVEEETAAQPARARSPRKAPKAPNIVEIEMNEPVSFTDFAAGKKNDSIHKRYLIAAAWLHDHRNIPAVTDGHIYTCFRSIGWSTNISDFGQPLRELKSRKFFTTPERGHYEINHIGLDYVNKKLANGAE
jgi:hypothetical protein